MIGNDDFEIVGIKTEEENKQNIKSLGYFKDAFYRFKKNKASIYAFFIIVMIILYALIIPILTPTYKKTLMNTYYSKKPPRISLIKEKFGILDGGYKDKKNEKGLIFELAKGVAINYYDNLSLKSSIDNKYQPVNNYKKNKDNTYTIEVDSYLSVGFVYLSVEQSEYHKIVKWESENNKKILYPLINNNEYCFDYNDANYWYKTIGKLEPVKVLDNGDYEKIDFSLDMVLEDNYLRDSNDNLVFYIYDSGGNEDTALYKIRVLYYNYYNYLYGHDVNYVLGTDAQGYDIAYRLATGIRLSLLLGITVSIINLLIGTLVGAIIGFYGGKVDLVVERIKDIIGNIPFIIVATLFQMHLQDKVGSFISLIFAFILTGWVGISSRVRTQFYRFKKEEYVLAAKTLGANNKRLIWKHVFPNAIGTIITSSVLIIPGVIFSESMLSFLGIVNLGGRDGTSLGTMLSESSGIWTSFPHLILMPAIVISLLMICFNLFGNGLRDAFNPALRGDE